MKTKLLILTIVVLTSSSFAGDTWPMFRGPKGDGSVEGSKLPLEWSEEKNVMWKTAIPHLGWCTPVVMDGKVWLTSATKKGSDFFAFCVDAETGKILVEKKLFTCAKPEPLANSVNCYAAPSSAIEKGRVYVHFGSYGTACLDSATGREIWKRNDMPCRHYRGPGSSVILYNAFLIVTFDGVDTQYVPALDKKTGKSVWKSKRQIKWKDIDADGNPKREGDFRKGFATPLVIDVGGKKQLVSPASTHCFGLCADTGKEIWRVGNRAHTPAVSPIFTSGLVVFATGHGQPAADLQAIKVDGTGDVTKTHLAWSKKGKDVPTTPSPVAVGDLLFVLSNRGTMNCYETVSGREVWRERIGGNFLASPIHDGQRIYIFSTARKCAVIKAGRKYELLAENELEASFMASPAVCGDSLILRSKTHLYRIGKK